MNDKEKIATLIAAIEKFITSHERVCEGPECNVTGIDDLRIAIRQAKGN